MTIEKIDMCIFEKFENLIFKLVEEGSQSKQICRSKFEGSSSSFKTLESVEKRVIQ